MLINRHLDIELECGVDESGAGPAFGPVVAAAVIMPKEWNHPLLDDSKKVSEKNRLLVYDAIIRSAISFSIQEVEPDIIDQINILQARLLAMDHAIKALHPKPEHVLIDGNRFYNNYNIPYLCVVKGDSKYISIAAASILAKVHRDKLMLYLQEDYANWNPAKHKGYLTREHQASISKWGLSDKHRKTFLKKYL